MKNTLYTLILALILAGCYKDEGNYEYNFGNMNEINLDSITFTPQSYESLSGTMIEIRQPMEDTLVQRVSVDLRQTLYTDYSKLDFLWIRNFTDRNSFGELMPVCDSVHTAGYVDLTFPPLESRTYSLRLIITDRQTELQYFKSLSVKTRPIYKNSLFVLHGKEPGERRLGNIEVVGTIANITTDAYKALNPESTKNPFANTFMLDFTAGINSGVSADDSRYFRTLCAFHEDGTANVWEPHGLTQKFRAVPAYVFLPKWGAVMPKRIIGLGDPVAMQDFRMLIDRNGRYYVAGSYFNFIPYDNKLSSDIGHQSDFIAAMGTIMSNYYIIWDSKNNRFLYQAKVHNMNGYSGESKGRTAANATAMPPLLDACVDFSTLPEGYSPVGKRAVYAYISSMGYEYNASHPFFIFLDEKTGEYYLYDLKPQTGDKDSEEARIHTRAKADDPGRWLIQRASATDPAFSITARKLPSLTPGDYSSSICYSFSFSTNYIFFIDQTGRTVYRYNTMNDELYTVYESPQDYTVTQIKFHSTFASEFQKEQGRYLSIALDNGKNGAVTEVKLDNTGDLDDTYPVVLYEGTATEKFGTIQDMQYVHEYLND